MAAIRVKLRDFKGQGFDKDFGTKEYAIIEWELDDGTFEYRLDCPLHAFHVPHTLPEIYPERQDEIVCPSCKQTYVRSKSKAIVSPPHPVRPFGVNALE
jgi:hypothetical protein